jgi:antitoxin (DNA-binding transcriptional repressor) of toxin-antitoxin stability system
MEKISIEDFQKNFNSYVERVERGESFIIRDSSGKYVSIIPADDEVVKIHTEHNDGC